ncbi:c-type cytochrome [Albidovulum sp.]
MLASVTFAVMAPVAGLADDDDDDNRVAFETPDNATDAYKLMIGGQIYDKWWETIGSDEPQGTHPAYPAAGKKSGKDTWRCKECHGWDYRGAAGAYGSGSHFTGIKGIDGMKGADPAAIAELLRAEPHGYTEAMIPDAAMAYLAYFVAHGQMDAPPLVDGTKTVEGDAARGAAGYQTVCARCHGMDGTAMNFGSSDKPEYLGTLAADNPWEAAHKIRFGQPAAEMPGLIALAPDAVADILSYAQTLPTK